MKLVKREHACLVIDKSDSTLVIDPGSYTLPLSDVFGVVAIVITHEHADHWTADHLTKLLDLNPGARILAPAGVAAAASDFAIEVVKAGDVVEIAPFRLEFFGGIHAVIHESIPLVDNVGVLVNDSLYYAGDSYTLPERAIETLAVPSGAPWLKIGDVMDYVAAVKPRRSFAVHEAPLSQIGRTMAAGRITTATEWGGGEFVALEPGDSLEL